MPIIRPFDGVSPRIAPDVFLADDAVVIGDVEIGPGCSIWYGTVIRGDVNRIRLGARVNVQDGSVIHVVRRTGPTVIEDDVTIGHRAVVHGCTVGRGALIGIGALVLDLSVIGEEAMVGAGAVVSPRAEIPAFHVALGVPARVVRPLTEAELAYNRETAENYRRLAEQHARDRLESSR